MCSKKYQSAGKMASVVRCPGPWSPHLRNPRYRWAVPGWVISHVVSTCTCINYQILQSFKTALCNLLVTWSLPYPLDQETPLVLSSGVTPKKYLNPKVCKTMAVMVIVRE